MTDSSTRGNAWIKPPAVYTDPPEYEQKTDLHSNYVEMRDGTKLAVDVWLPAGLARTARLPTIVSFTPYYRRMKVRPEFDRDPIGPSIAYARDAYVPYGYALVVVDVRGTGASFGSRKGFRSPAERDDYYDVADWIAAQSWCNGRIGSTGISYGGAAADFLASTGHPAVKAVIPSFAVWDTYRDMFYPGGLLCTTVRNAYGSITQALDRNDKSIVAEHPYFSDPAYDGPASVDNDDGTLLEQALKDHASNFEMISFIQSLECRDSSPLGDPDMTADRISPCTYAHGFAKDVAVYSVSGWWDGFGYGDAAARRHRTLQTPHKHLLFGPWDHGAVTNISPMRTETTPRFELFNEYRRFFDHYLKGIDTKLRSEAPVHYFTMIEEAWKSSDVWPPRESAPLVLYLDAGGNAAASSPLPDGRPSNYRVDFDATTGADTRYERIGLKDVDRYYDGWSSLPDRRLSFTTEPWPKGLEITGNPSATLFMSSTSRDGAIFAYLEDVDPLGNSSYVSEGVLRLIHRATPSTVATSSERAKPSFLTADIKPIIPGECFEVDIVLAPVSWLVRPGHRVRFSLAGADVGHFLRVPVGETPMLTIFHQPDRSSRLLLPVMTGRQ